MLEQELSYEDTSLKKSILEKMSSQISKINTFKNALEKQKIEFRIKVSLLYSSFSMILGALISVHIFNFQRLGGAISIGLLLGLIGIGIGYPITLLLDKNTEKFFSLSKKYNLLNKEVIDNEKELKDSLKDPIVIKSIVEEFQEIAYLMKQEKNNIHFETNFNQIIDELANNNTEKFKDFLLENFLEWTTLKEKTLKAQCQKEKTNSFLKSINVSPLNDTARDKQTPILKSWL